MTTQQRSVASPDATRAVDWEQRIDFPRLRKDRLTARNGSAYLALELRDRTGTIAAR